MDANRDPRSARRLPARDIDLVSLRAQRPAWANIATLQRQFGYDAKTGSARSTPGCSTMVERQRCSPWVRAQLNAS